MKFYFENEDDEMCYNLKGIKARMRDDDVEEREVFIAKKQFVDGFFWCSAVAEPGEKGSCGKQCSDYEPRNGKNGCCKFYKPNFYEATEDKKIIKL